MIKQLTYIVQIRIGEVRIVFFRTRNPLPLILHQGKRNPDCWKEGTDSPRKGFLPGEEGFPSLVTNLPIPGQVETVYCPVQVVDNHEGYGNDCVC